MVNQSNQSLFSYSSITAAASASNSAAAASASNSAAASASNSGGPPADLNSASLEELLVLVREQPALRDEALYVLSKKRDSTDELALALWHTDLIMTILLQEVLASYRYLEPMQLSRKDTDRVCNALTLFMRVASCKETRAPLLQARMLVYLYPFLRGTETDQQTEFLRLTSLGVIVSLVQDNDPEAVHFLLETEVLPSCLNAIERGSEKSKILATRVISKILTHRKGVQYCCDLMERFRAVAMVMAGMVDGLDQVSSSSQLLLKHIVDCYLKLSTDYRAARELKKRLPARLTFPSFINMMLAGKPESIEKLNLLLNNLQNV